MAVLAMMTDAQTIKRLPINLPWGKRMASPVCVTSKDGDEDLHCQVLVHGSLYAFHPFKAVEVPNGSVGALKRRVDNFPELSIEVVSHFDPRLAVEGQEPRPEAKKATDAPISYIPSKATLMKLSKTELAEFATAAGIEVPEEVEKRDLVAALDAAR